MLVAAIALAQWNPQQHATLADGGQLNGMALVAAVALLFVEVATWLWRHSAARWPMMVATVVAAQAVWPNVVPMLDMTRPGAEKLLLRAWLIDPINIVLLRLSALLPSPIAERWLLDAANGPIWLLQHHALLVLFAFAFALASVGAMASGPTRGGPLDAWGKATLGMLFVGLLAVQSTQAENSSAAISAQFVGGWLTAWGLWRATALLSPSLALRAAALVPPAALLLATPGVVVWIALVVVTGWLGLLPQLRVRAEALVLQHNARRWQQLRHRFVSRYANR